jgi:hypothetical protein
MMRNPLILVALTSALALSACAAKKDLGDRRGPDELAISRAAPLIIPEDFNLTPPRPGEPRATGQDAQSQAMEALFGPGVRVPPRSPAEQQLLDKAGVSSIDPAIRSQAGDSGTATVNKGAFVRELMDAPAGTVDPARAQVALGQ